MRIEQRHDDGEAFVGRTNHADAAVRFGSVLHQPVDGVVGIGDVIRGGRVQRAAHRPRHDIFALRLILAANILKNADVAIGAKDFVGHRQHGEQVRTLIAREAFGRVIRRPRQHDGRIAGAFGNHDDGIELDAVAHGNHHFALDVFIGGVGDREGLGNVPRLLRGSRKRARGDCQQYKQTARGSAK